MKKSNRYETFKITQAPEIATGKALETKVAIVGMGPVGLAAAIDLAQNNIASVVLSDKNSVSTGSRAICWVKRTLEIFTRLGVAEEMIAKGVTWKFGRIFLNDDEIYNFDLLPETGHKNPAFINLQQYYVEYCLISRCRDFPELIDLRFNNTMINLQQQTGKTHLEIQTDEGNYHIITDYLLACDGCHSKTRHLLNLGFEGTHFEENFLIIDIEMESSFPAERHFWFKPKFHPGQSALFHKQPDNIYRIDLQLPANSNYEEETKEENVRMRIEKMFPGIPFQIDWASLYHFQCRRIANFIHDRIIFLGDSAHIVSPFGARGGNGGIQDVDNLCWKLSAILQGKAGENLLASYNEERTYASDENIRYASNTANFMSPSTAIASLIRDNVLLLARNYAFARSFVNGGRLSTPCNFAGMSLQSNHLATDSNLVAKIGIPCPDVPLKDKSGKLCWLTDLLISQFSLLMIGNVSVNAETTSPFTDNIQPIIIANPAHSESYDDYENYAEIRYGQGIYLIRPDQHIAAAWVLPNIMPTISEIETAHKRALGYV